LGSTAESMQCCWTAGHRENRECAG
jgi:hypothetical protein